MSRGGQYLSSAKATLASTHQQKFAQQKHPPVKQIRYQDSLEQDQKSPRRIHYVWKEGAASGAV